MRVEGWTFSFVSVSLCLTEGLCIFLEGIYFLDGKGTVLGLMVFNVPVEAEVMHVARLNEAIEDSDMISM